MESRKVNWLILLALLSGMLGMGGCGRSTQTPRATARPNLESAQAAYLEGRFSESARLYGQARANNSFPADVRDDAAYWEGMSLLESGNLRSARSRLERLSRQTRNPALRAQAQLAIARSMMLERNYLPAESLFLQVLRQSPSSVDQASIYASLYSCARGRGDVAQANRYAEDLRQHFPESPYLQQTLPTGSARDSLVKVQVGVFSTLRMARALQKNLRTHQIETSVKRQGTSGSPLYVVQAGVFSTRSRAEAQKNRLRQLGYDAILKTR